VCFDLLGIDIFPVGENDDFLAASADEEVAAGIEVAEISGVQPAVAEHVGAGLGPVPISFHDDGAANGNLARGRRAFFDGFGIDDFGFDSGKGRSD